MKRMPWSTNQLKRLSRQIRDGGPAQPGVPTYRDVMLWYNDLAESVQSRIARLDWTPLLGNRSFEITSRPKTIDTLRQKLRREPSTPLPSVQDIAGVRFEAEMTLDEQDAVVTAIAGVFGHPEHECVRDLRDRPHSGYRAVHLWLRLDARVEVQVRTHLQGAWANMYEVAADVFGREIRYDELPRSPQDRDIVDALQKLSTSRVARIERNRNEIASLVLTLDELHEHSVTQEDYQSVRRRVELLRQQNLANEQKLRGDLDRLREVFRQESAPGGGS